MDGVTHRSTDSATDSSGERATDRSAERAEDRGPDRARDPGSDHGDGPDAEDAQDAVRDAADHPGGQAFTRAGLAARGVVYLVVSYLAFRIANGAAGGPKGGTDTSASGAGAVRTLAGGTGGTLVLIGLAVGLLGYAAFSGVDAVLHHDDEDNAVKRWGDRALSAWGALLYVGFAIYTVRVLLSPGGGSSSGQSGQSEQRTTALTAQVLRWPGGQFLVAVVAAILAVAALGLLRRAVIRGFADRFDRSEVPDAAWRVLVPLGVAGLLARAAAYTTISVLVFSAAIENQPDKAQGLNGSLRTLAGYSWGPWLLYPIAAGLGIFALYLGFEVRYRRVASRT